MYTCMCEYRKGVGLYACTRTFVCLSSICEYNSDQKAKSICIYIHVYIRLSPTFTCIIAFIEYTV